MQYADLYAGRKIRNTQTGEFAVIAAAAGLGDVIIVLMSGPDTGEIIAMAPSEVLTFWVGIS
jgi:hypothetical protein